MPDQFASDVPRVEIRENENVGVTDDFALRRFADGNFGYEGGVNLKLSIEISFDMFLLRFPIRQRGGGLDAADRGMTRTAFG